MAQVSWKVALALAALSQGTWPVLSTNAQPGSLSTSNASSLQEPKRSVSAPGTAVKLTPGEQAWLERHPVVRWGVDPDWPPFSSLDQYQRMTGIDADLTRLVARRAGLQPRLVHASSWAEVFAKARAGEVDFCSATAKSPERMDEFDYTAAYGSFPVVIITRNEAPFLTMKPNLAQLAVSAPRDHVTTTRLRRDVPSARITLTDTAEEALKLVATGKTDATILNLAVASRVIHLKGLSNLKISGVTGYEFPLRFAVRKDAPELTAILNKALATVSPQELESIYARHLIPGIAKARDWGVWRRRALYSALIGGGIVGFMLLWNHRLARQIRRRKSVEGALLKARDGLERRTRELDLRITEVEKLNSDLFSANQDLETFSSSVSHDLRGPVRRVGSFAELLRSEAGSLLSKRHTDWIALLIKESERMDQIIHQLLDLARLGRRDLFSVPVDMVQIVLSTMDDFQPQLRGRDVVWSVGELGTVLGDPTLLRCVVANLIDNALKYTRRCRQAHITIDALRTPPAHADEAVIYVRDNGCGFDMKDARKIFDPFQRLQHEKDYEGFGIGLANARKIIQKHGGQIWFESAPDQGATFYFSLARAQHEVSSNARDRERVSACKPVSPHHAAGPARFSVNMENARPLDKKTDQETTAPAG